ncbi:hypothetical protein JHK85_045634 [Glycine max]|nr:hypothetical protein JHK85_045634 [Glycine max]
MNLFTLDEKNLHRIFEGEALLHKMFRYYLLDETQNNLDYLVMLGNDYEQLVFIFENLMDVSFIMFVE